MSIFSCRDTVRLVSQSLDRGLAINRRLAVRVHLLLCPECSRFHQQLLFLHGAAGTLEEKAPGASDDGPCVLSPEARARIQRALEHEDL